MARNAEAKIQAAIVDYIRSVAPYTLPFHVPNGGLRTKSEAAKLKWMGTVAGIPDLALCIPGPRIAFIEVKCPGEYLSEEQKDIRIKLVGMGFDYGVAHSIDDVRSLLWHWRVPTREAVAAWRAPGAPEKRGWSDTRT